MTFNKIATSIVTAAAILSTAGASAQQLGGVLGAVDAAVDSAYTAFALQIHGAGNFQAYEETELRTVHMNNMVNNFANNYVVDITEGGVSFENGIISYTQASVSGRIFDGSDSENLLEKNAYISAVNGVFFGEGNDSLEEAFSGADGDHGLAGEYESVITAKVDQLNDDIVDFIQNGQVQDIAQVNSKINELVAASGIESSVNSINLGVSTLGGISAYDATELGQAAFDNQEIDTGDAGTYCYWNSFTQMTTNTEEVVVTQSGANYTCFDSTGAAL